MNIFEIYCAGEGRINEANMSSVLGYLLSPDASHGFGKESLNAFLEPLADEIQSLCNQHKLKLAGKGLHRKKIAEQLGSVEIEFEEDVYGISQSKVELEKRREIDLVIRFSSEGDKQKLVIAIENKISDGSSNDNQQLVEEYNFLRSKVDETEGWKGTPIIFVFLTPSFANSSAPQSEKLWSQLEKGPFSSIATHNDIKVNYTWRSQADDPLEKSITQLALNLLNAEARGKINPTSSYSSLFLKSLIKFIDNGFRIKEPVFGDESTSNGMTLLDPDTFWKIWANKKPNSFILAKEIFDILRSTLTEELLRSSKSDGALAICTRASTTRISLFFDDPQNPANLLKKRLSNRPVALFFKGMTSNSRIQIQFERRPWVTVKQFVERLKDQSLAELIVQTEPQHSTHTTMLIDVDFPIEKLKSVVMAVATEAAQSVLED